MNYVQKVIVRYKKDGIFKGTGHYLKLGISLINRVNKFMFSKLTDMIICFEKLLPIKNMIVFECESDMDDNPRAFYEYLLKKQWNRKNKIIWIVNDVEYCKENYQEINVVFICRNNPKNTNRIKLNYYLCRAKYFVFSHPYWFYKRKRKQIVFNIDHGLPMKKPRSEKEYEIAKCFDYIICPSEYMAPIFLKRYRCEREQLVFLGYPRCDYLWETNKKEILGKLFEFETNSKIIMCMPTFRQSQYIMDAENEDPYCLCVVQNDVQLKQLNNELIRKNIHIIVKPHPLQRIDVIKSTALSNIHYVFNRELFEKKIILYQILGVSDALISDLSSVGYDYSLTGKPMAYFMNNIESYNRGCIWDNPDLFVNGKKIFCYDDLLAFLECVKNNVDEYAEQRKKFADKVWGGHTINTSEQIYDWLLSI